jgi:hypothetical protein
VTHSLAATLAGSLHWKQPPASLTGESDEAATKKRLTDLTDRFIGLEKSGIKEYRQLLKESSGYYHSLFDVLLEAMIRDSEKHVELLEYLRRRLAA